MPESHNEGTLVLVVEWLFPCQFQCTVSPGLIATVAGENVVTVVRLTFVVAARADPACPQDNSTNNPI